jgi:hypothetical protein
MRWFSGTREVLGNSVRRYTGTEYSAGTRVLSNRALREKTQYSGGTWVPSDHVSLGYRVLGKSSGYSVSRR